MGIGSTFGEAFAKSQLGANVNLPKKRRSVYFGKRR